MRIISGIYKNRKINFKNLNIRPTTDFAKESLFNLLNNSFELNNISVLDLCAGSGNISYEFISRGAKNVTCVENNKKCVNFIKTIKQSLNMEQLNIISCSLQKYLSITSNVYDIIFADPPYYWKKNQYDQFINKIFAKNIINQSGMLIVEHSKFINFEDCHFFYKKKNYGRVHFTFLKYNST